MNNSRSILAPAAKFVVQNLGDNATEALTPAHLEDIFKRLAEDEGIIPYTREEDDSMIVGINHMDGTITVGVIFLAFDVGPVLIGDVVFDIFGTASLDKYDHDGLHVGFIHENYHARITLTMI